MGAGKAGPELVCPGCGTRAADPERFCPECGLPLVLDEPAEPEPVSWRRRWARKVKPQLAEGALVKVAWAHNQGEAELIQGLLLEQGVPSMLRRSPGFDVPAMLWAGPRDVLVPESGADTAREALRAHELGDVGPERAD